MNNADIMDDLKVAWHELVESMRSNTPEMGLRAMLNFLEIYKGYEESEEEGMAYGGEVGNAGQEGNFGMSEQRMQSKYFGEKY